jgi:hypothetical protein
LAAWNCLLNIFTVIFKLLWDINYKLRSHLGGVVVSVLATGPKGHGFKPGRGDGFLRAIEIHSTPSFRWEGKPEVPCHKILWHVKDPLRYFRY